MADSTPVQRKEHESSSKEASGDKKPKKDGPDGETIPGGAIQEEEAAMVVLAMD